MSSSAINAQLFQAKAGSIQNQADSSSIYSAGVWSFKNSTAVASVTITDAGAVTLGPSSSYGSVVHTKYGAMVSYAGFSNNVARPAIAGGTQGPYEIRGVGVNTAGDDGFLMLSAGAGTNANTKSYISLSGFSSVGDMDRNITFGTSGTERMRINTAGEKVFANGLIVVLSSAIGPGAGTYPVRWNASSGVLTYDSSSRLVKDQIEDIPYGLASVLSLQPRKYFRTDDQKEEIGFIADEVQSIIPEVVPMVEKKVFTKDEQDTELIPGGVNYDKLTAVLVKAIQELEARLAALESK